MTPTDPVVKWLEYHLHDELPEHFVSEIRKAIELAKAQGRVVVLADSVCAMACGSMQRDKQTIYALHDALRDYERIRRECD